MKADANAGSPPWIAAARQRLASLGELADNWDSYGARAVTPEAIAAVERLLHIAAMVSTPEPLVLPTARGGVQLEWHVNRIDVEIETLDQDRFLLLFVDHASGLEREAELAIDAPDLRNALVELSAHD